MPSTSEIELKSMNVTLSQGGQIFWSTGRFKIFLATSGPIFEKPRAENYIVTETPVDLVKKCFPRAVQKTLAGRIWPEGRTLPTPALSATKEK